jgi:hypothetical protein
MPLLRAPCTVLCALNQRAPRSAATGRRRQWPSSLAPSPSSQRPSDTAIGVSRHENRMKTKTGGRLGTGSRRGARPHRASAWLGDCTGVRVRGLGACVTAAARRTANGPHWKHGHPRATSSADPSCVRRRLCSGRWQVAPSACHTAGDQTHTRPAISTDACTCRGTEDPQCVHALPCPCRLSPMRVEEPGRKGLAPRRRRSEQCTHVESAGPRVDGACSMERSPRGRLKFDRMPLCRSKLGALLLV